MQCQVPLKQNTLKQSLVVPPTYLLCMMYLLHKKGRKGKFLFIDVGMYHKYFLKKKKTEIFVFFLRLFHKPTFWNFSKTISFWISYTLLIGTYCNEQIAEHFAQQKQIHQFYRWLHWKRCYCSLLLISPFIEILQ